MVAGPQPSLDALSGAWCGRPHGRNDTAVCPSERPHRFFHRIFGYRAAVKCRGRVGERLEWSGACFLEQRAVLVIRLDVRRVPGREGEEKAPLSSLRDRIFKPEPMAAEYLAAEHFRSLDESADGLRVAFLTRCTPVPGSPMMRAS